jgi:hypothetical protein
MNCTSNTIIKKPDNLIPKDEMVDLLTDMFLASGGRNIKNINKKRKVNYFPLVFEKYHIDSTQFKESNYYYISRINDYEEILKRVEIRLKAQRDEFDQERVVRDSLKRIEKLEQEIESNQQK